MYVGVNGNGPDQYQAPRSLIPAPHLRKAKAPDDEEDTVTCTNLDPRLSLKEPGIEVAHALFIELRHGRRILKIMANVFKFVVRNPTYSPSLLYFWLTITFF